ncbi:MAG TPA: polysaccharide biosynthesis/export family protein [Terriglobales bacterium]|nr:polysaccharide biosynthesis/export family protein [Terriglobales bacterium]
MRRSILVPAILVWACTVLAAQTPPPEGQRLAAGDLVEVSVFQAPELTTEARLDVTGSLSMPAAGTVKLAGDTTREAEQALAARLRADYLLAPEVHVLVRDFSPLPVTVLGAVKTPGVYSARSYPNLTGMLAAAGGIGTGAGERVLLTSTEGATTRTRTVELSQVERGAASAPIELHSGDVVRVVPAATVYVGGDVVKPGAYALPASGLTLLEAITLAGGVVRDGAADHTRIVHSDELGRTTVARVNARRVMQGRADDPALAPFDLIYVPHSVGRATVFRGLETALNVSTTIFTGVIIFH